MSHFLFEDEEKQKVNHHTNESFAKFCRDFPSPNESKVLYDDFFNEITAFFAKS